MVNGCWNFSYRSRNRNWSTHHRPRGSFRPIRSGAIRGTQFCRRANIVVLNRKWNSVLLWPFLAMEIFGFVQCGVRTKEWKFYFLYWYKKMVPNQSAFFSISRDFQIRRISELILILFNKKLERTLNKRCPDEAVPNLGSLTVNTLAMLKRSTTRINNISMQV